LGYICFYAPFGVIFAIMAPKSAKFGLVGFVLCNRHELTIKIQICASIFPALTLSSGEFTSLTNALAVCAYGNSFASAVGATWSVRGFVIGGSWANLAASSLFLAGMGAVSRALQLVVRGSSD
jgi:hypothetical protein